MFYDVFTELCENKGTTPLQVRKDLGISHSTMASWKSRGLTPNPITIAKLAEYFHVSSGYLLGKDDYSIPVSDYTSDIIVQMFNILNLSPQDQKAFDSLMTAFGKAHKKLHTALHDDSFNQKLCSVLDDAELQGFYTNVQGLIVSLDMLEALNPEGIYQLRENYKKWNDGMAAFNKVYSRLNEKGRQVALERMQEVVEVPRYQREQEQADSD